MHISTAICFRFVSFIRERQDGIETISDLQDEENLENLSSRMDVKKGLIRDLIAASISKLFTKKRYLEIIIKICPSMKMEKLLEKLGNQVTRCIIISVYFSL